MKNGITKNFAPWIIVATSVPTPDPAGATATIRATLTMPITTFSNQYRMMTLLTLHCQNSTPAKGTRLATSKLIDESLRRF